jgi:hypothetical protein
MKVEIIKKLQLLRAPENRDLSLEVYFLILFFTVHCQKLTKI